MSAAELSKTYDPATVEAETYSTWLAEKCFDADPQHPGEPYCIVMPPPNVTGVLHLGHAINNTLQDILIRKHRMAGFNVLWVPGIDHAGIATQAVVERQLKEKEGLDRHQLGREKLVERIWQWKQQYGDRILEQLKRLGCSCDWNRTHFTLDEMCAQAVRETFFKLFKDGLVYRGKRLVNWDVHLQTSISDDEIYHETVKTFLWHIKYPIIISASPSPGIPEEGRGGGSSAEKDSTLNTQHSTLNVQGQRPAFMIVATTRPETLLGDTAVAVHSQDPRWNWAIGLFVELPLTGRKIPIIADDILVDPKFGSGVVKVTPGHDPNDYAVYQRHLGKPDAIDIINLLNPNGTLNENAGKYAGLKRDAARKKVVEDLGELLVKEEPYETQVGHSDRSKTPIEPYLSDQWFVKMAPLAEPALDVVRDGTIKFFPERHAQQYLSWLGEKRDWPISRQLWWGHRIPVWRPDEDPKSESKGGRSIRQWWESEASSRRHEIALFRFGDGDRDFFVCLRNLHSSTERILGEDGFIQDPDVLDTWFSSALWPHSTLGWPEASADLGKWYPTSVLMTGRDIITLWVARMVMMGIYNMGIAPLAPGSAGVLPDVEPGQRPGLMERGIPFHHIAINPTILDGKGERMSKSKGNGVDPVDIIETHGADALRFTLTNMATETQDVRLPVKKNAQGKNTSDKFDLGRNFCTKLWNAAKFAFANLSANPQSAIRNPQSTLLVDRWIISRFNRTIAEANAALAIYRFDQYARVCYDFFWRDFCDWYVEAIKPVLKDPQRSGDTAAVLAAVLDGLLRLMHPMIPFITERLWWQLNEVCPLRGLAGQLECAPAKRLVSATWPLEGPTDDPAEKQFDRLREIIVAIRNVRNEQKADPKTPVTVQLRSETSMAEIAANLPLVALLAICSIEPLDKTIRTENAVRTTGGGCDIFIKGLDVAQDPQAAQKKLAELQKRETGLLQRLGNPAYTEKAPHHLVEQTRQELAAVQAEMSKIR